METYLVFDVINIGVLLPSELKFDAILSDFFFFNGGFRGTAGGFRFFTLEQFCHFSIAYKKKVSSSFYKTFSTKYTINLGKETHF